MLTVLRLTAARNTVSLPDIRHISIATQQHTTHTLAAQQNKQPNWHKDLPVTRQLADNALPPAYTNLSMANTAVLFVCHALQTTYNVVETMLDMGLPPKQLVMTGKSYSQNHDVVEAIKTLGVHYLRPSPTMIGKFSIGFDRDIHHLWGQLQTTIAERPNIENIIVIDHSGKGVQYIPPSINLPTVGIAKTTADIFLHKNNGTPIPLINMAQSCLKRELESPMIAQAVIEKTNGIIPELLPQNNATTSTCGVLGAGAIGNAVAKRLASLGHQVMVYDTDPSLSKKLETEVQSITALKSSCQVFATADLIFGCTGQPTDALDPLDCPITPKTCISCTSDDTEFKGTLTKPESTLLPSGHVEYTNPYGTTHTIVQQGFPANFDHSGESTPAQDIDITRAMTVASVYQAMRMLQPDQLDLYPQLYMLDPVLQQTIATLWLEQDGISLTKDDRAHASNQFSQAGSLEWISKQSAGAPWTPSLYKKPPPVLPQAPSHHHTTSNKNGIDEPAPQLASY